MNIFSILSGLGVIAMAGFMGYTTVLLFAEGGLTPILGGLSMVIISLTVFTLGVVLIGIGIAGIAARLRSNR